MTAQMESIAVGDVATILENQNKKDDSLEVA